MQLRLITTSAAPRRLLQLHLRSSTRQDVDRNEAEEEREKADERLAQLVRAACDSATVQRRRAVSEQCAVGGQEAEPTLDDLSLAPSTPRRDVGPAHLLTARRCSAHSQVTLFDFDTRA